jgi:porin
VNEIGFTRDTEGSSEQRTQFDRKRYPGTYKFGAAYNGGKFADAAGTERSGNYLIYGMANQALFRSEAGSSRGLDATLAFDWSPSNVNRENSQITAGVRYNGAIPRRPRDTLAFGFVHTKIGDPFRSIDIPLRAPMLGSEKAIELNYAAYLKPYLMCQPVFQYYWDVGGNSRVPDAAVMGFRAMIDF